jgi:hypothetical protein
VWESLTCPKCGYKYKRSRVYNDIPNYNDWPCYNDGHVVESDNNPTSGR